jgi:hypothetical protein
VHEIRFLIIDDFDGWELYVVLKVKFKNNIIIKLQIEIEDYCSRCPRLVDIQS